MAEIDEQLDSFETRIYNLETQEDAYKVLRQSFNTLKNQQIPVSKIQWDATPNRNLKQVLGNLDNMPYSNLREWLEHMIVGEGLNGNGVIHWEAMPFKNIQRIRYKDQDYRFGGTDYGGVTVRNSTTISILHAPCLLIVRCPFISKAYMTVTSGDLTLTSPNLTWHKCTFENTQYQHPDYNSGMSAYFYAQTFYTTVSTPGEYTLNFSNIPVYTLEESNYPFDYSPQIFSIYGNDTTLTKIESGVFETDPTTITIPANKKMIYFIQTPGENSDIEVNLSINPNYEYFWHHWFKTIYYESNSSARNLICNCINGYNQEYGYTNGEYGLISETEKAFIPGTYYYVGYEIT